MFEHLIKHITEQRKKQHYLNAIATAIELQSFLLREFSDLQKASGLTMRRADGAFWTCPKCGFFNYVDWATCAKCNTASPAAHASRSAATLPEKVSNEKDTQRENFISGNESK